VVQASPLLLGEFYGHIPECQQSLRTGHFFFHFLLWSSSSEESPGEITAASGENAFKATNRASSPVSCSPAGRIWKCRKGPIS